MVEQVKAMRAKRARGGGGFTLIELLVVIVILGVLAAVVVFAVGGISDRGDVAAFSTDADTLRTAQEANCAQNGDYADEAELVSRGLLASESTLNDIFVSDDPSGCGDKRFLISCPPTQAGCGQGGTTPDGNFLGADGSTPTGSWTRSGDLPVGSFLNNRSEMVTMPNGKVLFFPHKSRSTPPASHVPSLLVYDPSSGIWSQTAPMPGPDNRLQGRTSGRIMLVLEGGPSECGGLCGKVFVLAETVAPSAPAYLNVRAFIFDPAAYDSGADPWTPIDPPHVQGDPNSFILGETASHSPIQIPCSRADNPGSDCGKVLIPSSPERRETTRGWTQPPADEDRTTLFDPVTATWALAPPAFPNPGSFAPHADFTPTAALSDGRVLYPHGNTSHSVAQIYDPVVKTWALPANVPSDLGACQVSFEDGLLLPGGTRTLFLEARCGSDGLIFDSTTNLFSDALGCPCLPNTADPPESLVLPPSHGSKVAVVTSGNYPSNGQTVGALFDPDPANLSPWTLVGTSFEPCRNLRTTGCFATSNQPAAALLPSGQVLMAGGTHRVTSSLLSEVGMIDSWLYTPPVGG